jgi:hypothetical protein
MSLTRPALPDRAAAGAANPGSPALQFALSGASVAVANTCTIPLDVLKVRMQLAAAQAAQAGGGSGSGPHRPRLPGLTATALALARTEGPAAFFSGLGPALARGLFYGGARLGFYGPAKAVLASAVSRADSTPAPSSSASSIPSSSVALGVAAGGVSGVGAALLTSPIDLCKTRLQAPRAAGVLRPTVSSVVRSVVASDGLRGLWAGCGPAAARAAVQTASQCATYESAKAAIGASTGWGPDSPATHLAASAATGAVVTTTTAPIDLVKTRMMTARGEESGSGKSSRNRPSALRTAAAIVRNEGPAALMRGWTVQYVRLGPQSVVTFVVLERLRAAAGLGGF